MDRDGWSEKDRRQIDGRMCSCPLKGKGHLDSLSLRKTAMSLFQSSLLLLVFSFMGGRGDLISRQTIYVFHGLVCVTKVFINNTVIIMINITSNYHFH